MSVFIAVVAVTVYVPLAANPPYNATINGTACRGLDAATCPYPTGTAACSYAYPIGTRFELPAYAVDYGLPRAVVCNSRGGPGVGVDIALTSEDIGGDLERARQWGRRRIEVQVTLAAVRGALAAIAPPYRVPAPAPPRGESPKRVYTTRKDLR